MKNYILDMDGVLVRGDHAIDGAQGFIKRMLDSGTKFLILTNNPMYTQRDLQHRLHMAGLDVPVKNLFTSAMATAQFLSSQNPKGSAHVVGDSGLQVALHDVGYVITDNNPDYVVVGETHSYNYEQISLAVRLVHNGSLFIVTNPDASGPSERGIEPAGGALAALIEVASGIKPYFIGKPNPLMMRSALRYVGAHSEETVMVGDRMDTDVIAGIESGLETILVLSGVTKREDVKKFPYRPGKILDSVADIELE